MIIFGGSKLYLFSDSYTFVKQKKLDGKFKEYLLKNSSSLSAAVVLAKLNANES